MAAPLDGLDPISLAALDERAALLRRVDVKYAIVLTSGSPGVRAATSAYSYFVPGLLPGLPKPKPADSRIVTASRIFLPVQCLGRWRI